MAIRNPSDRLKKLALTGILAGIVVILQIFSGQIHFGPFSITLALVPIIVGGALCGPLSGAFLGLVFSVVVLINDSGAFLVINPLGTVLTVLIKGTLAGLVSALIYRIFRRFRIHFVLEAKGKEVWRTDFAVSLAAVFSPIVNTGIFLLGCWIFFMPTIREWAAGAGYENAGSFMILGLVGANFLVELAVVILLCPVIERLIAIAAKMDTESTE